MMRSFQKSSLALCFINSKVFLAFGIVTIMTATSCKKSDSTEESTPEATLASFKTAQEKYFHLTREFADKTDYYNSLSPAQRDAAIRNFQAGLESVKEPMMMTPKVRAAYAASDDCMENYMYCSAETMVIGYSESPVAKEVFTDQLVDWKVLTHIFNWWRVTSYETLVSGSSSTTVSAINHNGSVLSGPAQYITTWTENFVNGTVHSSGLFASMMIGGYITCGAISSGTYYVTQSFIPK